MKSVKVLLTGSILIVGIALAQQSATFTGVTEVRNDVSALRLLQCYREKKTTPVMCDLQFTNTTGDQSIQLSLESGKVSALATVGTDVKAYLSQNLKVSSQPTARQKILVVVDPRSSVALTAQFQIPSSVERLTSIQIGEFQLTDIPVSDSKPAQPVGTVTVLDQSALDFKIDAYSFKLKSVSLFPDQYTTALIFEGVNTGSKEEEISTSSVSARIFDGDSTEVVFQTQWLSMKNTWLEEGETFSAPPKVSFKFALVGNRLADNNYSSAIYPTLSTKPVKYLELNVRGEQRTFQDVDLRTLIK